jgi:hypothetical protein
MVQPMTTHRGAAALLFDDGRELTAAAYLRKGISGSWSGTLAFPAEAKTPELLNLTDGTLRVGDRDGSFVRPDTSDWLDSPAGQFRVRIEGNGDAPF